MLQHGVGVAAVWAVWLVAVAVASGGAGGLRGYHGVGPTFYEVMGVAPDVSSSTLRKTYRKLARTLHPDKHPPGERAVWEAKFVQLANAIEVLSDEDERAAYDQWLARGGPEADDDLRNGGGGRRRYTNFESAFQAHGYGVEDTPLNWAAVAAVMLITGAPLVMVCTRSKPAAATTSRDELLRAQQKPTAVSEEVLAAAEAAKASRARTAERRRQRREEGRKAQAAQDAKLGRVTTLAPKLEVAAPAGSTDGGGGHTLTSGAWSDTELRLLAKAVRRFPGGTQRRWEQVSSVVRRPVDDVLAKAKALHLHRSASSNWRPPTPAAAVGSAAAPPTPTATAATDAAPSTSGGGSSNGQGRGKPVRPWQPEEQAKFEQALRAVQPLKLPPAEKWAAVADHVPGRSAKECLKRFKHLAALVKSRRGDASQ